jgi:hypothetical protein
MAFSILIESRDAKRSWTLTQKPAWRPLPYDDEFQRLHLTTNWPGGYGRQAWRMRRPLRYEYPDIDYFNRVRVYDGPTVISDGEIWGITQGIANGVEYLDVICQGFSATLTSEPYNRIWSDNRFQSWYTDAVKTTNKPDKYIVDNNNRLFVALRRDVAYDNTFEGAWLFDEPFGVDPVARIEYDYDVVIAGTGTFKAQILSHSNQARTADENIDVDITATGSATGQTLNLSTARRYLSFRLFNDSGTPNTPTDDDGTNYAKLTNLKVQTVSGGVINAQVIATDILSQFDDAEHGLATSTDEIGALKTLVVEERDLQTPKYVIEFEDLKEATTAGDLTASYQRAYPVYANSRGRIVRGTTRDYFGDVTSTDDKFNGRYRTRAIDAYFTSSSARAQSFADLWLARNGLPVGRSRYVMQGGRVMNVYGQQIPLSHVRADGLLMVRNFRAFQAEAGGGSDIRDRATVDDLVHTEYDVDTDTLILSPGAPTPTVAAQVALIKRQIGPSSGWLQRHLGGLPGV